MFRTTAVITAVAAVACVGSSGALTVPNGSFETLIGDASGNPVTISPNGFTSSPVGPGMTLQSGTYSDGSTAADMVGWVGNQNVSVVAAQGPRTGNNVIALNAANWGNSGAATAPTTILSDSIGTADGSPVVISLWAQGNSGAGLPVVLDLLANGTPLTPTSAVSPGVVNGTYQEYTRTYDAGTMAAVSGQDLTIQFGLGPTGSTGGQVRFDDVSAIPEPTSLALLGLGGLLIARRRRG